MYMTLLSLFKLNEEKWTATFPLFSFTHPLLITVMTHHYIRHTSDSAVIEVILKARGHEVISTRRWYLWVFVLDTIKCFFSVKENCD